METGPEINDSHLTKVIADIIHDIHGNAFGASVAAESIVLVLREMGYIK